MAINWEKLDVKKINKIAKGLYTNPESKDWRSEYASLSKEEKEAVKYTISMNITGTEDKQKYNKTRSILNETE